MTMRIVVNPTLLKRRVYEGFLPNDNRLELGRRSGLSYPTMMKLTEGQYPLPTAITAYLEALGLTGDELAKLSFGDVFAIGDEK